ncbi:response regulator transcription factor [Paenibacillus sp. BSR1-1]|uniref:response regulator n=1 Tax=Paenibacillus sp. BSR1-1 TaxID=3020845 RepID=UPI0025B17594|nr:response regulator transcription factor [Paenibacillus sp. BSR1-1]MDN3020242.1 response regulator transcription factor [Paenibacillus sp. BSR1-1]
MIRIVIAEDQELLLGAIGSLLNMEDDMQVVGQAGNGEEAVALVHQLQPDVCIMDIEMPKMSGLAAAEALKSVECKVIILTTFARNGYFERALKADAKGYLLKDGPSEELACSIRSIMAGNTIYSPDLMDEGSMDTEQEKELLEKTVAEPIITNTSRNKLGMVRNYFSTILDKMKLPTG